MIIFSRWPEDGKISRKVLFSVLIIPALLAFAIAGSGLERQQDYPNCRKAAGIGGVNAYDLDVIAEKIAKYKVARPFPGSRGSYVPNEIIVKFKGQASETLAKEMSSAVKTKRLTLPGSIDKLNTKFGLKNIKPLFRDFKRKRARVKTLLQKDPAGLNKTDKRLMRRLKRAPKNVRVPELGRIYKLRLSPDKGQSLKKAVAAYRRDANVEYAELNFIFSASAEPNDLHFSKQWALNNTGQMYPASGYYNQPPGTDDSDIDAPEAWDYSVGSSEVIVAVVDTGVDYNHQDLVNNMWSNEKGFHGYDFVNDSNEPMDDHGHGTHCAGVIAAGGNNGLDITGVCWNTKIMALKFLNSTGNGSTDNAIKSIEYAVDNGADVLSNSWGGGGYSEALKDAIDYAHSQGVIVVAAAGNDSSQQLQYPGGYNNVIAVAATDSNDEKASFSNYGDWVDIAAPGVDILSLRGGGTAMGTTYDSYTTIASGTSMACPYVAGACALLLSVNTTLTGDTTRDVLMDTVDPIAAGICKSNGRLNILNATKAIFGHISLNSDYYSCSDQIDIRLSDVHLSGLGLQEVTVSTSGGDLEIITLLEETSVFGFFRGTVSTAGGDVVGEDGLLQVRHGEIITVTYPDSDDGTGSSAELSDTAMADCQGPLVSDVRISPSGATVTVSFETDEPATSSVRCRLSCEGPYTVAKSNWIPATSHTLKPRGFEPETDYYLTIETADALGNHTIDDNNGACYEFTTGVVLGEIYVPADFNSIQEAIYHARDGDIIRVADGVYTGRGNYDIDFEGLAITVRSENGPENCIIDCRMKGRGFFFHNGEDANSVLDGFTVSSGYPSADVSPTRNFDVWLGGGIYCINSSPTITNCIITECYAPYWGGGICVRGSSEMTISNCTISRNRADIRGGGIYFDQGKLVLSNCTVKGNNSSADGGGASLYAENILIEGCDITDNQLKVPDSIGDGGGVYIFSKGRVNIINSVISRNTAERGAGINLYGNLNCDVVMQNCIISGNHTSSDTGNGGGVYSYCRVLTFINCTICDNNATRVGGAIICSDSHTRINNCIISGNTTDDDKNKEPIYYNGLGALSIAYSDIENGQAGVYIPPAIAELNWDNSNIDTDPNFAFDKDYHLMNGSACIDAGTNDPNGPLPQTDFDGNDRSLNGNGTIETADMGAYEFNPQTPSIALSSRLLKFFCAQTGGEAGEQALSIRNCGGGTLDWQVSEDCSWLGVDTAGGSSTGQIETITVSLDSNGLSPGNYECNLTVSANNAVNSPQTVSVLLHVGGVFRVPGSYHTIQAAIDSAWDGDIVLVADGRYTGNGNRDIQLRGKAITLKSENGYKECIIDCQGTELDPHRGFEFYESGETADTVIDGFTITGGYVTVDFYAIFPPSQGGGIFCQGASPTISNCNIQENICAGGMFPGWGGGIMLMFGTSSGAKIHITNCSIKDNYADTDGGGIWALEHFVMTDSIIANNRSSWSGGGVFCLQYYYPNEIINSTICNNSASLGGGICVDGTDSAERLLITNCIFWDNTAQNGPEMALTNDFSGYPADVLVSYSDVKSGAGGVYLQSGFTLDWADGNIDADPLFVNAPNGDYHLQLNSPVIDSGNNFPPGGPGSTDIEGRNRTIDGDYDGLAVVDMGAYELLPPISLDPVISISAWEFDFIGFQNAQNPPEQILEIHNGGAGEINWTIAEDCDWLTINPQSGSSAGESVQVSLSADISGLARGAYSCELAILDDNAINSPRTFRVNLRVFIEGQLYVPSEYETIQAAINAAEQADTIVISPGTYTENITMNGKNISLTSTNPNDPSIIAETIIQGDGTDSTVTFTGSEDSCEIVGLTITGGHSPSDGGGISANGATAGISRCIIRDNYSENAGGGISACNGAISRCVIANNFAVTTGGGLSGCQGNITNCLIYDNTSDSGGGLNDCDGNIVNCTIVSNTANKGAGLNDCDGQITNCVLWANSFEQLRRSSDPTYSCIEGGGSGAGNIDVYPDFISFQGGDYHLLPGSFCIDAGTNTPASGLDDADIDGQIRLVDGDNDGTAIVDMGAYESLPATEPVIGLSAWKVALTTQNPVGTLNIRNIGGQTLTWSIAHNCQWLQAIPASGTSTGQTNEVTLTVDPNGLTWGRYGCALTISAIGAVNSPRTVEVTLHVVGELIYVTSRTLTIQDAIDSVIDGGEVIVADGIYKGYGNRDIDFRGKAVTVRSENGPQNCIIDPNGTPQQPHRGFYFHNNEDANSVLEGFTIINGYVNSGGGAIYCQHSSPAIADCIFNGNAAGSDDHGGAIYNEASSPTITNCIFNRNSAKYGGAIYNEAAGSAITNCTFSFNASEYGGAIYNITSDISLTNCSFSDNSAGNGGGIYNNLSNAVLTNCAFDNNTATIEWWNNGGGAVYNRTSSPILRDCTFQNNQSAWDGGAIFNAIESDPVITSCTFNANIAMRNDGGALYNIDRCSPKVDRCRFAYNIAGSWGGAMRNMQSSPEITNCNFIANSAHDNGGAIFNYLQSNSAITNCTFTANTADGNEGGGMYSFAQSIPTITNCIFRNNGGVSEIADDASITTVTYSNVTGGHPGEGNIDVAPLFIDPGYWDGEIWIDGDYHLSLNSPCINKGDPAGDYDSRVDIDNDPRVMEGRADIGSDECYRIIKNLKLAPMCSNVPESARRWRIHNRNTFDVETTWQVHQTDQAGIILASPGDSYFITDAVDGVNKTIIRWFDKDNVEHRKVQTSHAGQCPLRADLNYDGDIILEDFAEMAAAWLSEQGDENWNPVCDISNNPDNIIDMSDLVILSSSWLE